MKRTNEQREEEEQVLEEEEEDIEKAEETFFSVGLHRRLLGSLPLAWNARACPEAA